MIIYVSFELVVNIHYRLIEEYGGLQGLLNEGLLHSALEMPKAKFNKKDLHRTIYDKSAAYLFHLIQNHPFVDGNKRTASMVALLFFKTNFKGEWTLHQEEYQELILNIANGLVSKKEIAAFFRRLPKKG